MRFITGGPVDDNHPTQIPSGPTGAIIQGGTGAIIQGETVGADFRGGTCGVTARGFRDTGIYGQTMAAGKPGIFGYNGHIKSRDDAGAEGDSAGVVGYCVYGHGVQGFADGGEGHAGVLGQTDAKSGVGVRHLWLTGYSSQQ